MIRRIEDCICSSGIIVYVSVCACVCLSVYSNIGVSIHLYTYTYMPIQTTWGYIFPNLDQDNTKSLSGKIKAIPKAPFTPQAPFLYYSGTATVLSVPLSGHFLGRDVSPPRTVKFSLKKVTAEYCLQLSQYGLKGRRTASCRFCSCCWLLLNNLIIKLKKTTTFPDVDLHATAGRGYNDPDDTVNSGFLKTWELI